MVIVLSLHHTNIKVKLKINPFTAKGTYMRPGIKTLTKLNKHKLKAFFYLLHRTDVYITIRINFCE